MTKGRQKARRAFRARIAGVYFRTGEKRSGLWTTDVATKKAGKGKLHRKTHPIRRLRLGSAVQLLSSDDHTLQVGPPDQLRG